MELQVASCLSSCVFFRAKQTFGNRFNTRPQYAHKFTTFANSLLREFLLKAIAYTVVLRCAVCRGATIAELGGVVVINMWPFSQDWDFQARSKTPVMVKIHNARGTMGNVSVQGPGGRPQVATAPPLGKCASTSRTSQDKMSYIARF